MRVSELTGAALDWAVAKCEGATDEWHSYKPFFWHGVACICMGGHDVDYTPSTDWAQGGPIIERERITVIAMPNGSWATSTPLHTFHNPTPLIAAMRCYVASKLGDEVEVPEELK